MAKVTGLLNWLNRTTAWVLITTPAGHGVVALEREHRVIVRKYFDDRASKYERTRRVPVLVLQYAFHDEELVAR